MSMRSVSDVNKVRLQRERRYKAIEDDFWEGEHSGDRYEEFIKLVGEAGRWF